MEMNVNVGVSNRHVHLTKDMYYELFDEELTVRNELSQPGMFAAEQTVTLKTEKNEIKNVRILGPFRGYNQVEISATDARVLGLNPPIRKSGDLDNSESITLVGPKGEILLKNGCIIANRHLHVSSKEALKNGLLEDEELTIVCDKLNGGTMKCYVKILDNSVSEIHLDTDNANAFGIKQNDIVRVVK